jgi:SAM-dependent methyltransferase
MIATPRHNCRLCDGHLRPALSLGEQYLVTFPQKVDQCLPKAPLDLVQCVDCNLLQLGHTAQPDLLFRQFWYRTGINQTMKDAMCDVVDTGLEYKSEGVWLDIGANDGYLLTQLPNEHKWTKIACEPALNFTAQLQEHCDHVIPDYFSSDHDCLKNKTRGACDVITSCACFYDVDDPNAFVGHIKKALAPGGVWINQLNDSPTMLKTNAFDSVVHEHLCYYDIPNLVKLYSRHGLTITRVRFNEVNGGSIRVMAHHDFDASQKILLHELPRCRPEKVEGFAKRVVRWKEVMQEWIDGLKHPLWGVGASTKGSTMLQYLDRSAQFVGVADRNPDKVGKLMVGSWVPITDEPTFRRADPKYAVVFPYSFKREILEREKFLRETGTTFIFPLPEIEMVL